MFILVGFEGKEFEYIKKEACSLDVTACKHFQDERQRYKKTHSLSIVIGVFFCIMSWVPVALAEELFPALRFDEASELLAVSLFVMIAIGVFLFIVSSGIAKSYDVLLGVNDENTISGSYVYNGGPKYKTKGAETMMAVFWPTVTCAYLCWSFLTFDWHITWVVWPIAALVHKVFQINLRED